jgi:hypothetical protein
MCAKQGQRGRAADVRIGVVHTAQRLRSEDFEITIDGAEGSIETLWPGFTEAERLGVVVASEHAGAGASILILAAVTAFYDRLRAGGTDFFAYPDYFVFHVGRHWGSHAKLDIFRPHKELVVADDPEQILQAVNDRAITRLLVAEGHPRDPSLEPDTRASATRRIKSALAYSPDGRVEDSDVSIKGSAVTESFVEALFESTPPAKGPIRQARHALLEDGRPVETYRRLTVAQALGLL